MYSWSVLGILMISFYSIFLRDIKVLVAYRSVVHIRFLFICLIMNNSMSKRIRFYIMLGHGIISIMLFYIIGELYKLFDTRIIYFISGTQSGLLVISMILLIRFLANTGIPVFITFFSEVVGLRTIIRITP